MPSLSVSPTALQELQVANMLLEAEKEKVKSLQEKIKHLQADKEFLKDQLFRMTASSSSHSRSSSISGSSTGAPKRKGKKAIGSEVEESSGEIAVLSSESSTIDDTDDEEMKLSSKGKKAKSTKQDDRIRTR
ncbi:hypothetical protein NFI96_023535, partial [Prochilodus magdalenae]